MIFGAHSKRIVGVIECCKECPFFQVEEGAGAEEGEEEQAEEDEIVEGDPVIELTELSGWGEMIVLVG